MEYESNILKRLIDTYGVVGNPRYISEIIKEFIVRGKERFPELFTYQADWLAHIDEFGINPSYTVSYTGQSIYAPNTLERPVKSAILKGNTKYRDIDTGDILDTFDETKNLELVSVKIPVLKTTGKNLFDMNNTHFISGLIHNSNLTINSTPITKAYYIPCEPNTSYTISKELTSYFRICETTDVPTIGCKVSNLVNNPSKTSLTVTTSKSAKYLCFNVHNVKSDTMDESEVLATLQIEKGSTTTSYEPFKSNILTVNEEVTLRSNGDVYDELNLLTGRLTQRIDENNEVLAQEVVKTVDLTILDQNGQNIKQLMSFNGGTHFITGSLEGSPLPSVSVSVETDLEETLKVCSIEGNTM